MVKEKRTLWDRVRAKFRKLVEPPAPASVVFNPLNVKVGDKISVKGFVGSECLDGVFWRLRYAHNLQADHVRAAAPFVLYYFDRVGDVEPGQLKSIVLAYTPDDAAGIVKHVCVLRLAYSCTYAESDGLRKALDDSANTGEFVVEDDFNDDGTTDKVTTYKRVGGLNGPHKFKVLNYAGEYENRDMLVWDYARDAEDAGGTAVVELLMVLHDEHTGMYDMLVGEEAPASFVTKY